MRFTKIFILISALYATAVQAQQVSTDPFIEPSNNAEWVWKTEQFADIAILRYQVPGWDKLTLNQKLYAYYLSEAGKHGRDIIWDQNYRHNLTIRNGLENIYRKYNGDRESKNWKEFEIYLKRIWFSNGIHHHYSNEKFVPGFTEKYLIELLNATETKLSPEIIKIIFDPSIDAKKVSLDTSKDLLINSATNFYDPDITQQMAEEYYAKIIDKNAERPISYGLNSKLIRTPNGIQEMKYTANGLYNQAIDFIVDNLKMASAYAENEAQKKALDLLTDYYQTGDLKTWDDYNIAWVQATEGDIDYINSFIEVYGDPLGYKGSYESIVQIKDFEATDRMKVIAENAQWFEDNSPIMEEHKKKNVVGITYNVVNVVSESGDASPPTPIGVNLPNANWIRAEYGSKSVSLGNITDAYDMAGGSGLLNEFAYSNAEKERAEKYGSLASKMHTALHEVIGHASGIINSGVGTPKETLISYASTLEEGRADLVSLYYMPDPKLVEIGVIPSVEVGKAQYDSYMRNGLMLQLRRIEPGGIIEEAHMRNRQMIAKWVYEKGQKDNVVEMKVENGKTYVVINDYDKLRMLFGELLREIQRIKSEGDYLAGKYLVENYGVRVDPQLHREVLERSKALKNAPYSGFINAELIPVTDKNGEIIDIEITYPDDFSRQMLYYSQKYGHLPY
ncbi:MAG: dipeptidyl-peptidase 3 family protein [Chitinophagales bacterium]